MAGWLASMCCCLDTYYISDVCWRPLGDQYSAVMTSGLSNLLM
jgi:hypothetical protein